ncbi:ribosomal protein S18 acetylase RimI-like enzyme [Angulomicrobium tetraedrale]|uniref:Ribosomal protein S18 acetylase RimI-like enzyme n=1 Tax=Ancylobacter tetraedralis TaxID=217068 RepID=A0A839ZAT1_9HYPH|nr:GNAT family N-acetyltransferase [Ancylobacter tetraedralis]MBB3771839.1 ribosomal protein S18 acetylase RimI-like enzyme [Ancylobacter tetraedralis]
MTTPVIRPLLPDPRDVDALASILVATVAGGGSVGFLHPVSREVAARFWQAGLEGAARGERIILGAFLAGELAGTVTLQLALPENQPHRAEIAKMMTLPAFRGRGIASALLEEAERLARARGRTLLVLDTASEGGAAGLYEKRGFLCAGEIPGFALKPQGGLTGTRLYFKQI